MNFVNNDVDFISIVSDILNNKEFDKIKLIEHHGITRYEHSLKVAYYSYKIARNIGLDYVTTARGGLMHDFFLSDDNRTTFDRIKSTFIHPKYAAIHSNDIFGITKREYDIIRTHMFPVNIAIPKYAESWLVNFVDKTIAAIEFSSKYKKKLSYAINLFFILLINSFK